MNLKFDYKDKNGERSCQNVGLHSEMACFLKYGQEDTSDLIWVNIRIMRCGKVGNAKFCSGCRQLISQSGYRRAFYSINEENFGEFLDF